jgi:hypothetical protein
MRLIPQVAALALVLSTVSFAQDAIFEKAALLGSGGAKTTPVELVVSNTGVIVRTKDQPTAVVADLPYTSISNLGYAFVDRGRAWLLPVMGPAALFNKGQSHWLVIESNPGTANKPTVLRLDKSEYHEIVAALTARSGKRVEMLAPGSTLIDPTVGSHDEDQIVPFPIDQVRPALKSAMEQCLCKISDSKADRVKCSRRLRPHDSIGGGEYVTATLEAQGQQTQVIIKTQKGLGKNWSSPVFLEMLKTLKAAK